MEGGEEGQRGGPADDHYWMSRPVHAPINIGIPTGLSLQHWNPCYTPMDGPLWGRIQPETAKPIPLYTFINSTYTYAYICRCMYICIPISIHMRRVHVSIYSQ